MAFLATDDGRATYGTPLRFGRLALYFFFLRDCLLCELVGSSRRYLHSPLAVR